MNYDEANKNLEHFMEGHSKQWNPKMALYKVAATLDFGSDYMQKTDIDSTQVASDLSVVVMWEEKFNPHNEFADDKSLLVQRRYLDICDKANTPAFLILTSRRGGKGIVCGDSFTGLDKTKYLETISAFVTAGDFEKAEEALGNGIADIYSESYVIDIIPNETAKKHEYKTMKEIPEFWTNYKKAGLRILVDSLDKKLKEEFPKL